MLSVQAREAWRHQELEETKLLVQLLAVQVEKAALRLRDTARLPGNAENGGGSADEGMTRMMIGIWSMGRMTGLRHYRSTEPVRHRVSVLLPSFVLVCFVFPVFGWDCGRWMLLSHSITTGSIPPFNL